MSPFCPLPLGASIEPPEEEEQLADADWHPSSNLRKTGSASSGLMIASKVENVLMNNVKTCRMTACTAAGLPLSETNTFCRYQIDGEFTHCRLVAIFLRIPNIRQ
jgi:hypothetical protein